MNILPFVLVLILMLSVITIEKLEKFKNLVIVQTQYQTYIEKKERHYFNLRQTNLYEEYGASQQQLSFRLFIDKEFREKTNGEMIKQIRQITTDLIRICYSQTAFFKDLLQKRPQAIDEILDHFIAATDRLREDEKIRRIEDISRIQLEDPELQEAFYHMLKGTVSKKEPNHENEPNAEKRYLSLISFLNIKNSLQIEVQHASRELLQAIYGSDEIADAIITLRDEISEDKNSDVKQFEQFKGKQKSGITNDLLKYNITRKDHEDYN